MYVCTHVYTGTLLEYQKLSFTVEVEHEYTCVYMYVSISEDEPGWSSEGTGRGGRNDQRGVFGNGVTSVARGPVNR
jgi:hypothetical protein